MQNQDGRSAVNFKPESGSVDFQPEQESSEENGSRIGALTESVNWNKVGIGVGAAAAVAGAAYAAKRFIGSGSESGPSSGDKQSS